MRIKIEEPSSYIYSTVYTIAVSDLNYGNHLSNDRVLSIAHEARMRFLYSKGWSEMDLAGVSMIQADTAIVYKSEGFYGNEIEVQIALCNPGRAGFDMIYRMYNLSTKKQLALVKTGMVCYDYDERKVVGLPEEVAKIAVD